PLQCLLDEAGFDPASDQLWSVGDIVNRGPQSLASLRFIHSLGASVRMVLGNHDLHLLAVAEGIRELKRGDTLQEILEAPDRDTLLHWLRQQPLMDLDPDGEHCLVHAGLAPQWTIPQALALNDEVCAQLRGPDYRAFLAAMYGDQPDCWRDDLSGPARWRVITNYFTRMRFCDADGRLDLGNKGGPDAAAVGFSPWFLAPGRRNLERRILFGHWAALDGRAERGNVLALDTGCVWGRALTMVNIDTQQRFRCSCAGLSATA
ncbi:MAG TPA: symmetrical bis(5'-nucleosyl)-tetraphosphatase, partial [Spongiibacteraceae bacterium]|nr:symmetrical bis(5'-nucleosyl)-tetraphosphatase [Spongiibacteraceae bacterium]